MFAFYTSDAPGALPGQAAGHVAATGSLLVEPLQRKVGVTVVGTGRVDAVLIGDNLRKHSSAHHAHGAFE